MAEPAVQRNGQQSCDAAKQYDGDYIRCATPYVGCITRQVKSDHLEGDYYFIKAGNDLVRLGITSCL